MKSSSQVKLSLTELVEIIDNCIENGELIGIVCNKEIVNIIQRYLNDYDMQESSNVLEYSSRYNNHIKNNTNNSSNYFIVISCRNNNYTYFIDYVNPISKYIPFHFDKLICIGDELYYNLSNIRSRLYLESGNIEINDEELDGIFYEENNDNEDVENTDDCNCSCDCDNYLDNMSEEDIINEYINAILQANGCQRCVSDLVYELVDNIKNR